MTSGYSHDTSESSHPSVGLLIVDTVNKIVMQDLWTVPPYTIYVLQLPNVEVSNIVLSYGSTFYRSQALPYMFMPIPQGMRVRFADSVLIRKDQCQTYEAHSEQLSLETPYEAPLYLPDESALLVWPGGAFELTNWHALGFNANQPMTSVQIVLHPEDVRLGSGKTFKQDDMDKLIKANVLRPEGDIWDGAQQV